jgi:hypothetical protein
MDQYHYMEILQKDLLDSIEIYDPNPLHVIF